MPIYTYKCTRCWKSHDEFFFKYADKQTRIECPSCGGPSFATATVAHVAGRHTNKDTVKVPGGSVSVPVDGFRIAPTPKGLRKMVRKGKKRLTRKVEPRSLKTVREF